MLLPIKRKVKGEVIDRYYYMKMRKYRPTHFHPWPWIKVRDQSHLVLYAGEILPYPLDVRWVGPRVRPGAGFLGLPVAAPIELSRLISSCQQAALFSKALSHFASMRHRIP
jgi:hypothetical protein